MGLQLRALPALLLAAACSDPFRLDTTASSDAAGGVPGQRGLAAEHAAAADVRPAASPRHRMPVLSGRLAELLGGHPAGRQRRPGVSHVPHHRHGVHAEDAAARQLDRFSGWSSRPGDGRS